MTRAQLPLLLLLVLLAAVGHAVAIHDTTLQAHGRLRAVRRNGAQRVLDRAAERVQHATVHRVKAAATADVDSDAQAFGDVQFGARAAGGVYAHARAEIAVTAPEPDKELKYAAWLSGAAKWKWGVHSFAELRDSFEKANPLGADSKVPATPMCADAGASGVRSAVPGFCIYEQTFTAATALLPDKHGTLAAQPTAKGCRAFGGKPLQTAFTNAVMEVNSKVKVIANLLERATAETKLYGEALPAVMAPYLRPAAWAGVELAESNGVDKTALKRELMASSAAHEATSGANVDDTATGYVTAADQRMKTAGAYNGLAAAAAALQAESKRIDAAHAKQVDATTTIVKPAEVKAGDQTVLLDRRGEGRPLMIRFRAGLPIKNKDNMESPGGSGGITYAMAAAMGSLTSHAVLQGNGIVSGHVVNHRLGQIAEGNTDYVDLNLKNFIVQFEASNCGPTAWYAAETLMKKMAALCKDKCFAEGTVTFNYRDTRPSAQNRERSALGCAFAHCVNPNDNAYVPVGGTYRVRGTPTAWKLLYGEVSADARMKYVALEMAAVQRKMGVTAADLMQSDADLEAAYEVLHDEIEDDCVQCQSDDVCAVHGKMATAMDLGDAKADKAAKAKRKKGGSGRGWYRDEIGKDLHVLALAEMARVFEIDTRARWRRVQTQHDTALKAKSAADDVKDQTPKQVADAGLVQYYTQLKAAGLQVLEVGVVFDWQNANAYWERDNPRYALWMRALSEALGDVSARANGNSEVAQHMWEEMYGVPLPALSPEVLAKQKHHPVAYFVVHGLWETTALGKFLKGI